MPRKSSLTSVLNAMARDAARAQRKAEAEQKRRERERIQRARAAQRAAAVAAKEARQRWIESRFDEVGEMNLQLNERLAELADILAYTLTRDDAIDFDTLRIRETCPPFNPPPELTTSVAPPDKAKFLSTVKPLSFLSKLLPGATERHRRALAQAEDEFSKALAGYEKSEAERAERLAQLKKEYEDALASFQRTVQERDAEVDEMKEAYGTGDPDTVAAYNNMVLERSVYPDGFPQEFRLAYVPESRELVIDYELPGPDIVPTIAEYIYVKTKDEIREKPRKPAENKGLYQEIVASVALRTCHEVFEADKADVVDVVVFNGFVQAVDPSTGQDIRPCLISVRVTKERFSELDLSRIDKLVCLRNLGAQVSPRPQEVQAVKPIVEFDMVDKRFVEQSDVLADLESRPNLMDLNPFEFEHLIANLFKQIGLETKLTRSSRDGGVDVVAFDTRPVLGGKVVIQAKRYRNTVGVSAVRDLYGTMLNEGANKGILVTTSGYGPDAFDFAKDKPIELVDGGQLLYLLEQAGTKARIVFPEEGN